MWSIITSRLIYLAVFLNMIIDEAKIDSHLKTSAVEKFKDFIYKNYAKYIGIGKNKADPALNGDLSQLIYRAFI